MFGRLFIANQLRDGDLDVFFSHENQLHPPSLSDHGKIRACKKSDLIKCLKPTEESNKKDFDCKIFDGSALIHMLKPNAVKSFQEYAEEVFVKFIQQQLQSLKRIDIVWDWYLANSIKGSAREKHGVGVRQKVSAQSKIPSNWLNFLRDPNNKTELFAFLFGRAPSGPPTKAMQFSGNVYIYIYIYIYIFVVRCQLVSTEKAKHLL